MKIDKMEKADLPGVMLLAEQLGYPNSLQSLGERFEKILRDSDCAVFVAKSDTQDLIGWIQINREPTSLLVDDYADVAGLVVDENSRGQGVGKALLQKAESWARDQQINSIRVRSNAKRTDAHRFYVREGYDAAKVSNIFTKNV